jgi:hypothetical protein
MRKEEQFKFKINITIHSLKKTFLMSNLQKSFKILKIHIIIKLKKKFFYKNLKQNSFLFNFILN